VSIRLDHLGVVVVWTSERDSVLGAQSSSGDGGGESLLVAVSENERESGTRSVSSGVERRRQGKVGRLRGSNDSQSDFSCEIVLSVDGSLDDVGSGDGHELLPGHLGVRSVEGGEEGDHGGLRRKGRREGRKVKRSASFRFCELELNSSLPSPSPSPS